MHQDDIEEAVRFLKQECPKIVREAMQGHRNLSAHLRDLKIMQTNPGIWEWQEEIIAWMYAHISA